MKIHANISGGISLTCDFSLEDYKDDEDAFLNAIDAFAFLTVQAHLRIAKVQDIISTINLLKTSLNDPNQKERAAVRIKELEKQLVPYQEKVDKYMKF